MTGTCECINEPSDSIKCREFLDKLRTGYLLKKDSGPCSKWIKYSNNCVLKDFAHFILTLFRVENEGTLHPCSNCDYKFGKQ